MICTVPALPLGDGTTIWVDELLVKLLLGTEFEPKLTDVAPVKFVPLIVTEVPPAVGPDDGDTDVTVGLPAAVQVAENATLPRNRLPVWSIASEDRPGVEAPSGLLLIFTMSPADSV